MAEGTPLLREHVVKNCIEGSTPSVSAKHKASHIGCGAFFLAAIQIQGPIPRPDSKARFNCETACFAIAFRYHDFGV